MFVCRMPLIAAALMAAAPVFGAEEMPTHFVCAFDQGHIWSYEAGRFTSETPSALTLEISDIDLEAQSAKLVMDAQRNATLRIVRALNANHFLEVANEGFLNLTTIYDLDPANGVYPAVHSRHFGLLGQPVFAQYAGTCKAK